MGVPSFGFAEPGDAFASLLWNGELLLAAQGSYNERIIYCSCNGHIIYTNHKLYES